MKFIENTIEPNLRTINHSNRTLKMALDMITFIDNYTYKAGKRLHVKLGIHMGPCVFGVLGYHKPQFSLIGDTINTTSRHCTNGEEDHITLSEECWKEVKSLGIVKVKVHRKSNVRKTRCS